MATNEYEDAKSKNTAYSPDTTETYKITENSEITDTLDLEDGSTEYIFGDPDDDQDYLDIVDGFNDIGHYENLAEYIDEDVLEEIGQAVVQRYYDDKDARKDWDDSIAAGLRQLGLTDGADEEIFEGSSTVYHPLIIESAVNYQAKASGELFSSKKPVKTEILGKTDEELVQKATRVEKHMNYQVKTQMTEYFPEMEKLLFNLPIYGSAIKKTYWCVQKNRPVSEYIPIDNFYVDPNTTNLSTAKCLTHKIPMFKNDIIRGQINGLYREDVDMDTFLETSDSSIGEIEQEKEDQLGLARKSNSNDSDGLVYTILEQHVEIDLPEPYSHPMGLELPYIITVEESTGKVLSIRKNWSEGDENYNKLEYFTHYTFVPGFTFYGLGFLHLLGNLTKTLTMSLRSLLDSASFSNLQGGFVTKQAKIKNPEEPLVPGQFKVVEGMTDDLRKSIMYHQYKEPSNVMYSLVQFLDGRASRFADSGEQVIADSTNYGPVGTTMALLEASMKFFTAVHRRLHYAQTQEYKIIARLNKEYLSDNLEENEFLIPNSSLTIKSSDYSDRIDIQPVSDPNAMSQTHRIALAQTKLQAANQAPHLYDMHQVHKDFIVALGEEEPERLLPKAKDPVPLEPMEDIQAVIKGETIKAFPQQDHQAHIAFKQAYLQDPNMGANPMFASFAPVIQANIQEHMFLMYQEMVDTIAAQEQISKSQAAQRLAQMGQAELAQQQAQAEKDEALLIAAKAEETKAQADKMNAETQAREAEWKVAKEQLEFTFEDRELTLKEAEIQAKLAQADVKLDIDRSRLQQDTYFKIMKELQERREKEKTNKTVDIEE